MGVKFDHESFELHHPPFIAPKAERAPSAVKSNTLEPIGCELIKELARVGWEVEGLDVEFSTRGKGEAITRHARKVSGQVDGEPFEIGFGCYTGWTDEPIVIADSAKTPGNPEVRFYSDGSGKANPRAAAMAHAFIAGQVERLRRMPSAPGHDDVTAEGDANLRRLLAVEPVPAPDGFPVLYAWKKAEDARRMMGTVRWGEDKPSEKYALAGNGWRLVSLGMPGKDLHPRAHDGFDYASADPSSRKGHPGWHGGHEECFPVRIALKDLNSIFVVDAAAYHRTTDALVATADYAGRDRLTDSEIDLPPLEMAKTMVAAADYDGSFADPVYLIGRQLHADEASLVRGQIWIQAAGDGAAAIMRETGSDEPWVISESFSLKHRPLERLLSEAEDAAHILEVPVRLTASVRERVEANRAEAEKSPAPAFP